MIQMCHNGFSIIYDDERGNWLWKANNQPDQIIPKNDHPLLPLSAVIKYGMTEDNKTEMDKLRKQAMEE